MVRPAWRGPVHPCRLRPRIYTVSTRRWLGIADSTSQVLVAQQAHALALACLLVGAAWLWVGPRCPPRSAPRAGWVPSAGVLYYGVAYGLYLSGLRQVPASVAAVVLPDPGLWCRGRIDTPRRTPQSDAMAGAAIVLFAIYLTSVARARSDRPRRSADVCRGVAVTANLRQSVATGNGSATASGASGSGHAVEPVETGSVTSMSDVAPCTARSAATRATRVPTHPVPCGGRDRDPAITEPFRAKRGARIGRWSGV